MQMMLDRGTVTRFMTRDEACAAYGELLNSRKATRLLCWSLKMGYYGSSLGAQLSGTQQILV